MKNNVIVLYTSTQDVVRRPKVFKDHIKLKIVHNCKVLKTY